MIQRTLIGFVCLLLPYPVFSGAYFLEIAQNRQIVQRKWKTPHIKWRYNPTNAPAGAKDIIQQAFNTWSSQSLATVSNEYIGTTDKTSPALDGYSDIFFNVSVSSVGASPDTIAITLLNSTRALPGTSGDGTLVEADILVNPALISHMITTVATDPSDLDLMEILAHEIGHAYGLAHSFLIDSLMYPAKPPTDASTDLKNLFRTSKRTLAQDDKAWMGALYPPSNFEELTTQISGNVSMNHQGFTGAQVIAVKTDGDDELFTFYSADDINNVVVKGLQNVAAFSDKDGNFLIKGLNPGNYKIFTQNASSFMGFTLANVNTYLNQYQSAASFPPQFWTNPDCANHSTVSTSSVSDLYDAATTFSASANKGFCGIDIISHSGGNYCGSQASQQNRCSIGGDGGCSLTAERLDSSAYLGLLASFFVGLVLLRNHITRKIFRA